MERVRGLWEKLGKYKYAALVLLLGVALMLWPDSAPKAEVADVRPGESELCEQLESVLCQVAGAGEVHCLLTWSEGPRTIYQTDSSELSTGEVRTDTVLASGEAVPVGEIGPVWQGVVVVCDGADSAQLRLELTRAVSALTGLSSDKIAVVKRKGQS